jgi:hypothetical protein
MVCLKAIAIKNPKTTTDPMKFLRFLTALTIASFVLAPASFAGEECKDKKADKACCSCGKDKDGKECGKDKPCCCAEKAAKKEDKKTQS